MKRGKGERGGKLYSCQEKGICDRLRVVPNAGAKHRDSQSSCLLTFVFAAGPMSHRVRHSSAVSNCPEHLQWSEEAREVLKISRSSRV